MTLTRTIILAITSFSGLASLASEPLPAFNGDPAETSVSGLSAGAFMAVQYQVAFSSTVKGSGIVAGGPYYCAGGKISNAGICMGLVPYMLPSPASLVSAAQKYASEHKIDPLTGLQSARVYVFSGTKDSIVKQTAVDATVAFFKKAGVSERNLAYVNNVPAGHALITQSFGNDCAANATPYISHCSVNGQAYDQAGVLLQHIYGKLNPPAKTLTGKVLTFNQREFAATSTGLADDGYVYVPKACNDGADCKVHIALHGCTQSSGDVGNDFYLDTGYNPWADTNQILVLYPQVSPSSQNSCWDWFGYTNSDYATKSGVQMAAIKAMVDQLIAKQIAGKRRNRD